ncbi:hypothetical protein M2432_001308 [Mycobacterium sp. OTB74]|nr:hypothetical protein [Mycobacterium sp. OTB74]
MSIIRTSLLVAVLMGGTVVSIPVVHPPAADAAPCRANEQFDPRTGICWSSQDLSNRGNPTGIGGTGHCSPGRLGTCLGAAQNGIQPGANLRPQPPAGPAPRIWPSQ